MIWKDSVSDNYIHMVWFLNFSSSKHHCIYSS